MRFEVSEEFILDAHDAACSDWRQKIEYQFPTLFKYRKYENRWVSFQVGENAVEHKGRYIEYDYNKELHVIAYTKNTKAMPLHYEAFNIQFLSELDIREHIFKLLVDAGYTRLNFKCLRQKEKLNRGTIKPLSLNNTAYVEHDDSFFTAKYGLGGMCIYEKGCFAEIIPEPKKIVPPELVNIFNNYNKESLIRWYNEYKEQAV